jgi:hypothetical protein
MGKNAYIVDHNEIVEVMFEIRYNRECELLNPDDSDRWNLVCDEFNNELEGDYSLSNVKMSLKDEPDDLLNQALLKIMVDYNKKSLTIIRD